MRHRLTWLCLYSTTLLLLASAAAQAQRPIDTVLPREGTDQLERAYSRPVIQRFQAFREGKETPSKSNAEDLKTIDLTAQWYAYRLTWSKHQAQPPSSPSSITALYREFTYELESIEKYKDRNEALRELFYPQMASRLKDVLPNSVAVASVNAARMLASMSAYGIEPATDVLAEALADPRVNDGARLYALRGLGSQLAYWADELAKAGPRPPPPPKGRKEKEERYVTALIAAIERKPAGDVTRMPPEEKEGLKVLRREAVRSLAQVHTPALVDDKGAVKVRVAQALLRVVNNDGLIPEVRLDEQLDAAVGLARMHAKSVAGYQPDYVAHQLGHLVVEFASRPLEEIGAKFPRKYHAARLADALDAMRADAKGLKDQKVADYVAQVVGQSLQVLAPIEAGNQSNAGALGLWLSNNPPPNGTIYQGLADSTVKPYRRSEEPAAEKPAEGDKPGGDKKTEPKKP